MIEDLKGISTADYREQANPDRKEVPSARREGFGGAAHHAETIAAPSPPPPPLPTLDAAQQRVFDALATKRHADELVRELSLSAGDLSRTLMQLELKKVVRRLPGNFYERR